MHITLGKFTEYKSQIKLCGGVGNVIWCCDVRFLVAYRWKTLNKSLLRWFLFGKRTFFDFLISLYRTSYIPTVECIGHWIFNRNSVYDQHLMKNVISHSNYSNKMYIVCIFVYYVFSNFLFNIYTEKMLIYTCLLYSNSEITI